MVRTGARALLLAAGLLLGTAAAAGPSRRAVDEASAVVAYLYNFGKFIEWPAATFPSPEIPMRFCFYGDDSLGSIANSLTRKRARGQPIEIDYVKRGGSLAHCHLLYIDTSEQLYVRPVLNLTQGKPIVTVSEIDGFAAAGGTIGLVYSGSRLRFEVNSAAAAQSRLRVSSQLLKLAVDVIDESRP
jgi:hypothetical protein